MFRVQNTMSGTKNSMFRVKNIMFGTQNSLFRAQFRPRTVCLESRTVCLGPEQYV